MSIEEEKKQIHVYSVLPKKIDSSELPWWKRLWNNVLPWGKNKIVQGERYVESEIQVKEADARLKNAQALKEVADAERIMMETALIKEKLEEKEIIEIKHDIVDDVDLQYEIEELKAKIRAYELKYGVEVDIQERNEKNQLGVFRYSLKKNKDKRE